MPLNARRRGAAFQCEQQRSGDQRGAAAALPPLLSLGRCRAARDGQYRDLGLDLDIQLQRYRERWAVEGGRWAREVPAD